MDASVLSLQSKTQSGHPVRRYYKRLGFVCTDNSDDGGLMLTLPAFQAAVKIHPELWLQGQRAGMSLYQLFKGHIFLQEVPLTLEDIHQKVDTGGQSDPMCYNFAKFPCSLPMNVIEGYLDSCPIMKLLSAGHLPQTNRPLLFTPSMNRFSGIINGNYRQQLLDDECSFSRDAIQFLLAFLLRTQ